MAISLFLSTLLKINSYLKSMIELKLKRGKEESLDRFHPWVFSGALASEPPEELAEGDVVGVTASDGRFLGT